MRRPDLFGGFASHAGDCLFEVTLAAEFAPAAQCLRNLYGGSLTVGDELNKLASNIAIGRDAAGVHWRSDGIEGLNLGEAVAIHLLQDLRRCYNENFTGFSFTRFDGTTMTI